MDFKTPSVNQIAEFFLYLFQERKLQPFTIVGYRTAIADKVGNYSVEISKVEVSTEIGQKAMKFPQIGQKGYPLLKPISCFTLIDQGPHLNLSGRPP